LEFHSAWGWLGKYDCWWVQRFFAFAQQQQGREVTWDKDALRKPSYTPTLETVRQRRRMNKLNLRIEIKKSLSNSLPLIGGLILLLGHIWYNKDKWIGNVGEPLFVSIISLIFCYLLFSLYSSIKRETVMVINNDGVFHKKHGLMKWDDILSIKKTRRQSGDSEIVILLFQTTRSSSPYEISISNMDISEEEIIKTIKKYKDYNIYEVPSNEW
jgi:hypothetical protein